MDSTEDQKSQIARREEKILDMWDKGEIFKKTLEKESPKGNFVFYDGPPFATGIPHYGHMIPGTMKDIIPKYKTMQGYHVNRRWGWDCHGLPIENLIEKELGLKNKRDIESYGIEKFNEAARASVLRNVDVWKKMIARVGRFVDMDNAYLTMNPTYTESVWWSWKSLFDKGLVYDNFKVMPYCPHCGTTLSNFEVNQGYKDITDISAFAKFKVSNKFNGSDEPTYLLAWTTTPWTLPGNTALAVNKEEMYALVEFEKEHYVALAAKIEKLFKDKEHKVLRADIAGKDLVGIEYIPVFDYYQSDESLKNKANGWKVYAADFVTVEDGTGIVHIAPAYGDDDYQLSEREGVPMIHHVKEDGTFKPEVKDFAGQAVKPKDDDQKADIEVIKYLAHNGLLFAKEKIIHSYPHCWRCDTPLLNYATSSWFVKVTALKDRLIEENKKVRWVPEEIGAGRFGKWLEGARDWAVSRTRFWGAPLPIWKSEDGKEVDVIGSIDELKKRTDRSNMFYLVRHGQGEHNVKNVLSSKIGNTHHLTDLGKEQVKEAAEALKSAKIDIIYASDFVRTKETAEMLAEAIGFPKEKILYDARLHEVDFGELEGKNISAYHEMFPGYESGFEKSIPGGESLRDIRKRVGSFVYEIDNLYENKRILVVSHETPLWMFQAVAKYFSQKEVIDMRAGGGEFIKNGEVMEVPFVALPHNLDFELDLHRPYIDAISWSSASGKLMKRVPDIFDTWYDSGSMPFAQNHYPFSNKKEFEEKGSALFPAEFIAEGLDQTRGWFYTLLVLSTALFDESPYKNVVVNGLLLAEDGRKMSKSLKNYPEMGPTIDKYGADALRYFLMSSPAVKAEDVRFTEKSLDEVVKKHIQRLDNVYAFYEMYKEEIGDAVSADSQIILDRWIVARFSETRNIITNHLEKYEFDKATRPIADFVDDLSTWYVRRSRDRFKSEDIADRTSALVTTRFVLNNFAKLLAPFMPFVAEDIYQKTKNSAGKESVHLESWPEATVDVISTEIQNVLVEMHETRNIVSVALEARVQAGIKVRQPLSALSIKGTLPEVYLELIKDEVNVKNVIVAPEQDTQVILDIALTPELKLEGSMRELLRAIQEARKVAGLNPREKATALVPNIPENISAIETFEKEMKSAASLESIVTEERKDVVVTKV